MPLRYLAEDFQIAYFFGGVIIENKTQKKIPNLSQAERTGIWVTLCSDESQSHEARRANADIRPGTGGKHRAPIDLCFGKPLPLEVQSLVNSLSVFKNAIYVSH